MDQRQGLPSGTPPRQDAASAGGGSRGRLNHKDLAHVCALGVEDTLLLCKEGKGARVVSEKRNSPDIFQAVSFTPAANRNPLCT